MHSNDKQQNQITYSRSACELIRQLANDETVYCCYGQYYYYYLTYLLTLLTI